MTTTDHSARPNVMIVDDTPLNLQLLELILDENGYQVAAFPSGAMALEACVTSPPDLVLLDVMMPGMDGYEVCRRLKADPALRDIPVIFISALGQMEDKLEGFACGGADFITKPFQEKEVRARIDAHLEIVGLRRKLQAYNEALEKTVAERTRELAVANRRIQEMSQIKDRFLEMISHEIRTPANGIVSIAEILLSELGKGEWVNAFRDSATRLQNLVEDASTIGRIELLLAEPRTDIPLQLVLAEVAGDGLSLAGVASLRGLMVHANKELLVKTLHGASALAARFCRFPNPVRVGVEPMALTLSWDLDVFTLKPEQLGEFFTLESTVRSASAAEGLGLAPVVTHLLAQTIGGDLQLACHGERTGVLKLTLYTAAQKSG